MQGKPCVDCGEVASTQVADHKVPYTVLWQNELSSTIALRADTTSTLSSAGLELLWPRVAALVVLALVGIGVAVVGVREIYLVRRNWRNWQRVARAPRPMFVELESSEAVRSYGIATGSTSYAFRAPNGEIIKQTLSKARKAVFDASGSKVLIIAAEDSPNAEPLLVADDGYPFALACSPSERHLKNRSNVRI